MKKKEAHEKASWKHTMEEREPNEAVITGQLPSLMSVRWDVINLRFCQQVRRLCLLSAATLTTEIVLQTALCLSGAYSWAGTIHLLCLDTASGNPANPHAHVFITSNANVYKREPFRCIELPMLSSIPRIRRKAWGQKRMKMCTWTSALGFTTNTDEQTAMRSMTTIEPGECLFLLMHWRM